MKKFFGLILALILALSLTTMAWGEGNVAKVGDTEYATIDEAIAAWTNGTTLTLLSDVTLSDVITLKSTEHHILNLGTYTMTATAGKNAFVIKACGTGDAERYALTINADTTNPGGINAGSKSVVYYKYADGGISTNDRPIIKINGGIFTGSTSSWGTAGIYTIGTAARKCATLNISGGTFNCSINGSGKSKLLISGGTFNYSVGSQGDSTCYRLISGGAFKTIGFMTADSNNTKFWIGTAMGNSNVGVYVNDTGYIVVGGPVITEAGTDYEASTDYSYWSNYLKYSSAASGLYWTDIDTAMSKESSGEITVHIPTLSSTRNPSLDSFKGTLLLPNETSTLSITCAEGDHGWKVSTNLPNHEVRCAEADLGNGNVTHSYTVVDAVTVTAAANPTDGGTVALTADPAECKTIKKNDLYEVNTSITVTATPEESHYFVNWTDASGAEVSTSASYTFVASSAVEVTANFTAKDPEAIPTTANFEAPDKITGLAAKATYTVDGTEYKADADGEITVFDGWYGKTISIVKKASDGKHSDSAAQAVDIPARYTVTFDANGGTGTMSADYVVDGNTCELPANGFTAPGGRQFKAWSVNGVEKKVGDKITITADTEVKALWKSVGGGYYVPVSPSTNQLVQSADTFDGGIALAVSTSLLSVTGSALLLRKRED